MTTQFRIITLSLAASMSLLVGCSVPEDPYASTCQNLAENLSGIKGAQWEPAEKKETQGEHLRVDISSPQTTATCLYLYEEQANGDGDNYTAMEYSSSPYEVYVQGVKVKDVDLIKAAVSVLGADARKGLEEAQENAKKMLDGAGESATKAMGQAQDLAREKLLNVLEK